jgi:hypothetical protein
MISPNDIRGDNAKATNGDAATARLGNFALPPLRAGEYVLETEILLEKIHHNADVKFTNDGLRFVVTAPQWAIDTAHIYNVYPPARSSGAYHESLPHIVFTRKTLPWEREIENKPLAPDATPLPWMALLLVTESERNDPQLGISLGKMRPEAINQAPADPSLLTPKLQLDAFASSTNEVDVMEMNWSFFKAIAPGPAELPLLTHIRQVDTLNKANAEVNPKGWFSVMMGHRLPRPDQEQTVYLVSLEGHASGYWGEQLPETTRIRLVVLHQWSFRSEGNTFKGMVKALANNVQPLRLDWHYFPPSKIASTLVEKPIQFGYMPLNHHGRRGHNQLSWYTGPLVPVAKPNPQQVRYAQADQALRLDEPTGMFDISYATAWQLGRLLGLQNPNYYIALNNLQTQYEKENSLRAATEILQATTPDKSWAMDEQQVREWGQAIGTQEILLDYVMDRWAE